MAKSRRSEGHLGIDTNVLVAYLDRGHPSHGAVAWLSGESVALNPTIVHEAYHTLVFKMKWKRDEARNALIEAITDEGVLFINQTLRTTRVGIQLAANRDLGGRDGLIVASFLVGGVRKLLTLDRALLALKTVALGDSKLEIRGP